MSESNQKQSVILYICIGVLIPIIAALIPYGHRYLFPEHDLNYSIISKTKINNYSSIIIELENDGEKPEKNIEVAFKKDSSLIELKKATKFLEELGKKEAPSTEELKNTIMPQIEISPGIPYTVKESSKFHIVMLKNMRFGEKFTLSILSNDISIYDYEKDFVRVQTEDNIARLNEPSEFLQVAYPFTFWMFIILMTLGVITGIYQEYLENPKSREDRLLKEIDKLKK